MNAQAINGVPPEGGYLKPVRALLVAGRFIDRKEDGRLHFAYDQIVMSKLDFFLVMNAQAINGARS